MGKDNITINNIATSSESTVYTIKKKAPCLTAEEEELAEYKKYTKMRFILDSMEKGVLDEETPKDIILEIYNNINLKMSGNKDTTAEVVSMNVSLDKDRLSKEARNYVQG